MKMNNDVVFSNKDKVWTYFVYSIITTAFRFTALQIENYKYSFNLSRSVLREFTYGRDLSCENMARLPSCLLTENSVRIASHTIFRCIHVYVGFDDFN